jgi:hypothetical protein
MAGFSGQQLVVIALIAAAVVWASNRVTSVRRVIG